MITEKISKYLKDNGIQRKYIAEKIKMPINVLSMTLNGKRRMQLEEFIAIVKVLNLDPNYFLDN